MKVIELIEKMKQDTNINLKDELEVRTYIPIAEKRIIMETILDKAFVVEDGVLKCDCVSKNMIFELAMIKYHTNLEVDINSEDDYDAIETILVDEIDLRALLLSCYRKDYEECKTILEYMAENLRSQYSIEASVAKMTNAISNSIKELTGTVSDNINNFDLGKILPKDVSTDDISKLLEKYVR